MIGAPQHPKFVAWQPSTWPAAVNDDFIHTLKRIFENSMLAEIKKVIDDGHKRHGKSDKPRPYCRGCAPWMPLPRYGYRNHHLDFSKAHFRADYRPFAENIYRLHRNSLVHSWNLFEAAIYPNDTKIRSEARTVAFGLLDVFTVLVSAAAGFLNRLAGMQACRTTHWHGI